MATKKAATETTVDAAADAIVDRAMALVCDWHGRREREDVREELQDLVDRLIDECRDYYRAQGLPPDEAVLCRYCGHRVAPRDPYHVHGHNECCCGVKPRHNAFLHDLGEG